MWQTSAGDRTLEGREAALVAAAITAMVEQIREESSAYRDQLTYGIALFDDLTWTQRLATLDQVATYLLTPTKEPLELTAVAEATVGALFDHVRFQIDLEIEEILGPGTTWRQMVLDAYDATQPEYEPLDDEPEESGEDYGWGTSSADCCDRSAWWDLVESLTDQILWDRDYEMMSDLADQPPEQAALLKSYLGIDDDYFAAAGPDAVTETAVANTLHRLSQFRNQAW